MSYQVNLQYFKDSGKFYSETNYTSEKEHVFEIFEEVREMFKAKLLPGLVEGSQFTTLVTPTDHPYSYPLLILKTPEPTPSPAPEPMLKTYSVKINGYETVEATTEEEARELAEDLLFNGYLVKDLEAKTIEITQITE